MDNRNSTHARNISDAATLASSPVGSTFVTSERGAPGLSCTIPPEHQARTLVLCFDGTGDQFDSDVSVKRRRRDSETETQQQNSNVVQLSSLLKKDDRNQQMVYYQAGIGTYTIPKIATPMRAKFYKMVDEAIAWSLNSHVIGGYEFLMQSYTAGDRICIFGFSRGAYTARALAGMVHKVGLLPPSNHQQIPFAYKMFSRVDEMGWKQSNAFKKAFSVNVKIDFIGVWDTVNSVGLITSRAETPVSKTEAEYELLDALAPVYDQLSLNRFWWLLEILPLKQRRQKEDDSWRKKFHVNMGKGRRIPRQRKGVVKVHRSVKMRMEAQYSDGGKYNPKASFEKALGLGNIVWVD